MTYIEEMRKKYKFIVNNLVKKRKRMKEKNNINAFDDNLL